MWEWDLTGMVYASMAPDDFLCLSWPEAMGSGAEPVTMAYHYDHVWDLRGLSAKGHTLRVVGILITKPKHKFNFCQLCSDTGPCQTLPVSTSVARQSSGGRAAPLCFVGTDFTSSLFGSAQTPLVYVIMIFVTSTNLFQSIFQIFFDNINTQCVF